MTEGFVQVCGGGVRASFPLFPLGKRRVGGGGGESRTFRFMAGPSSASASASHCAPCGPTRWSTWNCGAAAREREVIVKHQRWFRASETS